MGCRMKHEDHLGTWPQPPPSRRRTTELKEGTGKSTLSRFEQTYKRRNLNMAQVEVIAGVGRQSCRALRKMEPKALASMHLGTLMRIAMVLRCKPSTLIPALNRIPLNVLRGRTKFAKGFAKAPRELDIDECEENMTGMITRKEDL